MRRPIVVITAARAVAQAFDLGGRHEAAGLMRERCELVEALSAKARELHALLEVAATICEGSTEAPSQYEIEARSFAHVPTRTATNGWPGGDRG